MQNKFFVTGATGLVGSHIVSRLIKDGFSCIALSRKEQPEMNLVQWIKSDLLEPENYESHFSEINTIIHAAGLVSYQKKDKNELLNVNYRGTRELVNYALNKQVKNLIFISSASTLIRSGNPSHISLNGSGNPVFNSHYAKTKFLAELEIWRAAAEGMNVCILYPSLVIGHGSWNHSSLRIFKKVEMGITFYPPGNLGIVAADDLAGIVLEICKSGISNQQHLVNAEVWSYNDFLNEIGLGLKKKEIKNEASYWQAKLMSIVDGIRSSWNNKPALITNETIRSSFTKFSYESDHQNFNYRDIRSLIREIIARNSSN